MKIRVLLNIGLRETEYPHLKEGEHEVSRADAMKLIERGWAVPIEPPAKPLHGVPPESAIQADEPRSRRTARPHEPKTPADDKEQ